MPAFSHCFLKRFMAFSNDSPSLTRTPGILGTTTFRCGGNPRKRGSICSLARLSTSRSCAAAQTHREGHEELAKYYAVPVSDLAGTCSALAGAGAPARLTRDRHSLP